MIERAKEYLLIVAAAFVVVAGVAYVSVSGYRLLGVGQRVQAVAENQQRIVAAVNQLGADVAGLTPKPAE